MKNIRSGLTMLTIFFYSCSGGNQKDNSTNEQSINKPIDSIQIYLDNSVKEWSETAKVNLTELLNKFELHEDKVEGGGWYVYKKKKDKFKSHIEVPVSTNGYFYLKTNYCGSDWIFHNCAVANIEGVSYYSSSLEHFSNYIVEDNNGSNVFESCHLTKPSQDGRIIQAIAANQDKEIIIRLKGDQKYQDIKLSKEDKEMIRDCFYLSQWLTVTQNQRVKNIVFDNVRPSEFFLVPEVNYPTAEINKTL